MLPLPSTAMKEGLLEWFERELAAKPLLDPFASDAVIRNEWQKACTGVSACMGLPKAPDPQTIEPHPGEFSSMVLPIA